MKTRSLPCHALLAAALLSTLTGIREATAFGLGPYLAAGQSKIEFDRGEADADFVGFGVAMDTNVGKDSLFNYRLQLGYSRQSYDLGGDNDRFEMNHSFGFSLLRQGDLRLWVGPQLGAYYEESSAENSLGIGGLGVGPVVGLNIGLGPALSLALSAHARYGVWVETEDNERNNRSGRRYETTEDGTDWNVGANVALLFRMGEDR